MEKAANIRKFLVTMAFTAIGSALCAVAINGVLVPLNFLSGGFTGFAIDIHYLFPQLEVGVAYALINIPVFILGWFFVGRRFFLNSLVGTAIFSAMVAFVEVRLPVTEMVPAALVAGILFGLGLGIILRSQGSSGGVDILSVIFTKRFSIKVGTTTLALDIIALSLGLFIVDLDMALYTLIHMFVTSQMINLVLFGLSRRKAVTIISTEWDAIRKLIIEDIDRGVTVVDTVGGFTDSPGKMLYAVVTLRELGRLKLAVRELDPRAFLVVNDTTEVMGWRIGNQLDW